MFFAKTAVAVPSFFLASSRTYVTKSVYVGNLAWTVTADDIMAAFKPHSPIILGTRIIKGPDGRSRGFGFVDVDVKEGDEARLEETIQTMNGSLLMGRALRVLPSAGGPKPSISPREQRQ